MPRMFLEAIVSILLGIVGAAMVAEIWNYTKRNQFPVDGKTVLLTGASQGMGREIARLLSARGANVILVARTIANLQEALQHAQLGAKNQSTQRFHYICADVTSETENARILDEATIWNQGRMPDIVWCVAGAASPGLFMETSTDTLRRQMELNYFATAYMAHKALHAWFYPAVPHTPQQKGVASETPRKFIITSSAIAFVNLAGYSPYAPAKAALRSLADGLRSEVQLYNAARRSTRAGDGPTPAPFDVNIHIVFPGSILSPGFEKENKTKHPVTVELEKSDPKQKPLEAATAAIEGLEGGNFMTPTNWLANLMRCGALSGSERNNVVLDTLRAWFAPVIWLYMVGDLDRTVWKWGKENGMQVFNQNAQ